MNNWLNYDKARLIAFLYHSLTDGYILKCLQAGKVLKVYKYAVITCNLYEAFNMLAYDKHRLLYDSIQRAINNTLKRLKQNPDLFNQLDMSCTTGDLEIIKKMVEGDYNHLINFEFSTKEQTKFIKNLFISLLFMFAFSTEEV